MRLPKWIHFKTLNGRKELNFRTGILWIFLFCSIGLYSVGALARPWNEHTQHLAATLNQIQVAEQEIQKMIKEKQQTHNAARVAEIMNSISERQRAIEKNVAMYEEERQHVRFEHPEKNDQLDHSYLRHEVKSIEELENDLGIDARLDRIKIRVLAKFPIPDRTNTAEAKKFRTRMPASKTVVLDEDAPDKVKLVK